MPIYGQVQLKKTVIGKLGHDKDLLEELQSVRKKENVLLGRISAIGAVKKATSKYKGVNYRKDFKKYRARIVFNGRRINLGHFDSEVEAGQAYDEAAKKYHGEFAVLNFETGYAKQRS